MTRSLYSKFILGYLIFGLLGFIAIATFSSKMTRDYLVQSKADALYDEAISSPRHAAPCIRGNGWIPRRFPPKYGRCPTI